MQTSLKKRLFVNPLATFNQPTANKPIPIRYNNTCMVVQLTENWVSFSTLEGRKKLSFDLPNYYENRKISDVKSTELWKDIKHNKYFLSVVVEQEDPKFEANGNVIGVDLGIKKPAVTSKDCDHVLSRKIVDSAVSGNVVVLENLTSIRNKKYGRDFNRKLHTWSFLRLRDFIDYKAKFIGCITELISPKYTSQECSVCHHISRKNRKTSL